MRELLVIRHGVTETNERGVFAGAMDVPLSPGGIAKLRQSRALYPAADVFFTSGMLRARQSLRALYGDVPRKDIADLGEYHFGAFEGRSHAQLCAEEPQYRAWLAEDGDHIVCPGGESRQAFSMRIARGWRTLAAVPWDSLAVLVSHGGTLTVLMGQLFPKEAPFASPHNGCGWHLSLDGAGTALTQKPFLSRGDFGGPFAPGDGSSRVSAGKA